MEGVGIQERKQSLDQVSHVALDIGGWSNYVRSGFQNDGSIEHCNTTAHEVLFWNKGVLSMGTNLAYLGLVLLLSVPCQVLRRAHY